MVAFVLATIALAGTAWVVSFSVEQVGHRLGPAPTGVLQATVANLPEFFVVVFALNAGQRVVAQSAIVGSVLVNALLVLGLVIIAGARRADDGVMRFNPRLPNDTATLLLIASFIIALVGLANSSHDAASHHIKTISIISACAILVVYGVWLRPVPAGPGWRGHWPEGGAEGARGRPGPSGRGGVLPALGLLITAGVASAFVSEWFVHALEPTIHTLGISQAFAGLVIVAIAGNAIENVTAIALAFKGQANLAISVVKNSVAQIAAFVYPLLGARLAADRDDADVRPPGGLHRRAVRHCCDRLASDRGRRGNPVRRGRARGRLRDPGRRGGVRVTAIPPVADPGLTAVP